MAAISLSSELVARLESAQTIWLASVRPGGSPHLAPVWFVWDGGRAYVCTPSRTVKARNIALNRSVALSLEDGEHPVIIEGEANRLAKIPPQVANLFLDKYDWQIVGDDTNDALFEIIPKKMLNW